MANGAINHDPINTLAIGTNGSLTTQKKDTDKTENVEMS